MNKFQNFILSKAGLWILFIVWSLFISHFWLPRTWGFFGGNDWDLTYSMFEVARKSIVDYHQWPQWNPWMAFGSDLNANPQSGHMSIFFIPILIFGTFYGYKLSILIAMVIGCFGAYKWFKSMNENSIIAVFSALIFCSATFFSSHIFEAGHSNILYMYLLPWFAFSFIKLRDKYQFRYLFLAIIIATQMIVGGAPMAFIMCCVFMSLWIVGDWWANKNTAIVWPFIVVMLGACILGLWKILPGLELWNQTPRHVNDPSGINILQWLASLAGYSFRTGTWHAHFEYNLGFGLILLGVIYYYRNQIAHWQKWCLLFLLTVWFCLGNSPSFLNPWYWLNQFVPPFNSMRAPSRFGIILVFALCTALVYAIKNAAEIRLLTYVLFAAALSQSIAFYAESSFMFDTPIREPKAWDGIAKNKIPQTSFFKKDSPELFSLIMANNMVPNAYEPLNLRQVTDTFSTAIKGGEINHFTANAIEVNSDSTVFVLNMRYSPHWQLFGPGQIRNHNGHLAVVAAKGTRILTYHNPWVTRGLWWSLLIIPVLVGAHWGLKRKGVRIKG